MTTFPGSPRLLKGGIVQVDARTLVQKRIIVLQYNPETLKRTLQVQGAGPESGDRLEALRLIGPPIETIQLEAEIDAADQLEFSDPITVQYGIHPQLAALETIIYPLSRQFEVNKSLAQSGKLEIMPMEAHLSVFVWSENRIMPVRLTEFSITEEAFDPGLNPLRAKVSLGMRVLNMNDLGFYHKGSDLFAAYHKHKETLAAKIPNGVFSTLGIGGIT